MDSALLNDLSNVMQTGVKTSDQANDLLARCYNAISDLQAQLPKQEKKESGKWGMSRLWRAWMASTAEWMAGNNIVMPKWMKEDGTYSKEKRPFNKNDAHELFTIQWMGTDEHGNRLSWAKEGDENAIIADKGQRFYALQQHQIWMTERGIKHINPREGEFASLCAIAEGRC